MKETEKNVLCVLLQRLLDKNLITPIIYDNAREQILATCTNGGFFTCDRKEELHGSTQDPQ